MRAFWSTTAGRFSIPTRLGTLPQDLAAVTTQAEQGSRKAAARLAEYYQFAAYGLPCPNPKGNPMKKNLILPLLLALSLPALADPIDDFAQAELERQKIPGLAVGIYRNGNIVKQQGYGLANVEHQIPVSADTVFQTASIGKMFAAAVVMLLVEDGKIHLDQSVRAYLPEAPKSWQPITIRHLLNHTGGIGNTETDWQQNSSDKQMLRRIYTAPLQFKLGSRWAYSNNGYAILGAVITRVSGKHYGEILQERVFAPLGMTSARVISERDIVPHRAAGYELDDADDGVAVVAVCPAAA